MFLTFLVRMLTVGGERSFGDRKKTCPLALTPGQHEPHLIVFSSRFLHIMVDTNI